jgi:hypothetical protein
VIPRGTRAEVGRYITELSRVGTSSLVRKRKMFLAEARPVMEPGFSQNICGVLAIFLLTSA